MSAPRTGKIVIGGRIMNFETNIFKKIGDIRQDLDMTQKAMAEKMQVKQGVYSRWENGKEIIPLRRLNQFCNITGYKMDYIIGLSRENKMNPITKEISLKECGERIRQWRKKLGMTQVQLAEFLNTTQSTVSAYESGQVLILTAFAYQISTAYKISMDYLCGRSDIAEI